MGAICEACKQDMLEAKGCTFTHIILNEKPIKRDLQHWQNPGERCQDCGALYGEPHHVGCDIERCPICKGQLLGCGCFGDEEVTLATVAHTRSSPYEKLS